MNDLNLFAAAFIGFFLLLSVVSASITQDEHMRWLWIGNGVLDAALLGVNLWFGLPDYQPHFAAALPVLIPGILIPFVVLWGGTKFFRWFYEARSFAPSGGGDDWGDAYLRARKASLEAIDREQRVRELAAGSVLAGMLVGLALFIARKGKK